MDHLGGRPRGGAAPPVAALAAGQVARCGSPGGARRVDGRVGPGEPGVPQGRRRTRDRLVGLRGPRLVAPDAERLRRLRRVGVVDGPHRLRPDAARLLRPRSPRRRHGRQPRRGVAVLPHLPALLRPAVRGTVRQGPRARLRPGLQRLDGGGVGGGLRRAARPPVPRPVVGSGAGRRGGPPQRRSRRAGGGLLRAARQARAWRPSTTPAATGSHCSGRAARRAPPSACTSGRDRRG